MYGFLNVEGKLCHNDPNLCLET